MLMAYATIFVPIREARREKARRAFDETYRAFQLYYVKKHYPEVKDLSYEQLKRQYDISAAYNSLSIRN
jgi:hypothetical protein